LKQSNTTATTTIKSNSTTSSTNTTTTTTTTTKITTTTSTGATTSTKPTTTTTRLGQLPSLDTSRFPWPRFRYGRNYDRAITDYVNYDYLSVWIGADYPFNPWHEGEMSGVCRDKNLLPVYYGYVTAFEARRQKGIQDCDILSVNNLCTDGAEFIRNNRQLLVDRYGYYASEIAKIIGKNSTNLWIMEPDFYQYSNNSYLYTQKNGPLSGPYMRQLLDDYVAAIKTHLPNALISWDISPWLGETLMKYWWSNFATANYINFIKHKRWTSKLD
jgi:hypothetical protein